MRILPDTCVGGGTRAALESAGHDVIWAGDWEEDPGDDETLAYAHHENRILVTLDKDFGELVSVYHLPQFKHSAPRQYCRATTSHGLFANLSTAWRNVAFRRHSDRISAQNPDPIAKRYVNRSNLNSRRTYHD